MLRVPAIRVIAFRAVRRRRRKRGRPRRKNARARARVSERGVICKSNLPAYLYYLAGSTRSVVRERKKKKKKSPTARRRKTCPTWPVFSNEPETLPGGRGGKDRSADDSHPMPLRSAVVGWLARISNIEGVLEILQLVIATQRQALSRSYVVVVVASGKRMSKRPSHPRLALKAAGDNSPGGRPEFRETIDPLTSLPFGL